MSTEPLRISVEIAREMHGLCGRDTWTVNESLVSAIDARVMPLVLALQRVREAWQKATYDEDFVYNLSRLEPEKPFPEWLDAALKDAGVE